MPFLKRMLIYSAGLRISEVVKLRVEDIDAQRKLLHIRSAKGKGGKGGCFLSL
jgi:site-specific recombinase XerD